MTKQGNNDERKSVIRKQRNTKNNDTSLVMDWIIDRVGGINVRENNPGEKNAGEKKKIVISKKLRRHSF